MVTYPQLELPCLDRAGHRGGMHAKVLSCVVVGLPDTAVQESRERVRAAIRNTGLVFPMRRITASLAPAELRKSGPAYDLPIAVAILLGSGQIEGNFKDTLFLGELSLDGGTRRTQGVLPMRS